jgi:hypothetical protein
MTTVGKKTQEKWVKMVNAMPPRVVPCLLGAGTFVMVIAVLAATCFNGQYDLRSKWLKLQLGPRRTLHILAIVCAVFSVFSALWAFLALYFNCAKRDRHGVEIVLWLFTYAFFFVTAMTQIVGLVFSRWGDQRVPYQYNLLVDDDFQRYWQLYVNVGRDPLPGYFMNDGIPWHLFPHFPRLDLYAYMQPYYVPEDGSDAMTYAEVTSCAINFSALVESGRFSIASPCSFTVFGQDNVVCCNDWTFELLMDYWCDEHQKYQTELDYASFHDPKLVQERQAVQQRGNITLNSPDMFFQNNRLLLGVEIVAFLVSLVSVIVDITWRRTDAKIKRRTERLLARQRSRQDRYAAIGSDSRKGRPPDTLMVGGHRQESDYYSDDMALSSTRPGVKPPKSSSSESTSESILTPRRVGVILPSAPSQPPPSPESSSAGLSGDSGQDYSSYEAPAPKSRPRGSSSSSESSSAERPIKVVVAPVSALAPASSASSSSHSSSSDSESTSPPPNFGRPVPAKPTSKGRAPEPSSSEEELSSESPKFAPPRRAPDVAPPRQESSSESPSSSGPPRVQPRAVKPESSSDQSPSDESSSGPPEVMPPLSMPSDYDYSQVSFSAATGEPSDSAD